MEEAAATVTPQLDRTNDRRFYLPRGSSEECLHSSKNDQQPPTIAELRTKTSPPLSKKLFATPSLSRELPSFSEGGPKVPELSKKSPILSKKLFPIVSDVPTTSTTPLLSREFPNLSEGGPKFSDFSKKSPLASRKLFPLVSDVPTTTRTPLLSRELPNLSEGGPKVHELAKKSPILSKKLFPIVSDVPTTSATPLLSRELPNLSEGGPTIAEVTGTSPLLSKKFQQDAAPPSSFPKTVPFGRSRRMSRSLPELRDLQFVSVLPDVEEEESETSECPGEQVTYEKPTRVPWHRKLDFVWCSVCHALGLGNIWRFPYYCYSNGGGSFLIPYLVFLVICGVPFLCMELAVGQLTQSGPISAFGQLCPLMKGIGVSSMVLSFWLTTYYSVLSSWTLFYTFNSFYSPPRWTLCSNTWNSDTCIDDQEATADANATTTTTTTQQAANATHPAAEFLDVKLLEKSSGIWESGELRFELLASVLFVWILSYVVLRKTDFFRGVTICVLTVLAHLLLFSLFIRTVALQGGKSGLQQLFQPQWNRMFSPRVLLYALSQAFHSLGVVLGPSILMGSCHKQTNNLLRDTIVLTCVTLLTVLVIGCITFATIGHLAVKMDKPFYAVLSDDPSNVFVLYSAVIGSMPLPSCWGVLFFLVLLFLGLDSQIKLMATLVSAVKEAYTYYIKQRFQGHSLFLAVLCGFCFVICIPYITRAGIFYFQLIDHFTAVVATTVVALFEVFTLGFLYGTRNLSSCIQQMTGKPPCYFYQFCWMALSPFTILIVLVYWFVKVQSSVIKKDYEYPQWAHIVGWILFVFTVCWIPILAVAAYRKMPKSDIRNKLRAAIQPRLRSPSDSRWQAKPVIILNGSTASDYPDYKPPELPTVPNAVQSYVEKHSIMHQNDETIF